MRNEFFVPFNTPSSKNSRRLVKGGRFIASKQTMRWRKLTEQAFKEQKDAFRKAIKKKDKPYKIGFFFIRDSKRKFDFNNMTQAVQDAMVHHEWLEDDNIHEMVPIPLEIDGVYFKVDKDNAGVIIRVL